MNVIECLKSEGLLKEGEREPRFREISDGLYRCEDDEFMQGLPKPKEPFISYHQLCQDRSEYKPR
jgi:hypothetical protein